MRKSLLVGSFTAACLLLAACGAAQEGASDAPRQPSAFETPFGDDEVYPRFVSSQLAVGNNRVLVGLLNAEDAPVGGPDIDMHVDFFDLDRSTEEPVVGTDMRWVWITKPYAGLYASEVTFDSPGRWGAEVRVSGGELDATVRASFEVREDSTTPAIGEPVPASDTPTARTARDIARISTDPRPKARFYESSVAEALEAHEPFVLVFATPKFCATQSCGPMLDTVKEIATDSPDVTFIHVEPYELPADPAALEPVPSTKEWGLPSEPWTFVVDSRGRLAAKFEGALGPGELREVLRRLR